MAKADMFQALPVSPGGKNRWQDLPSFMPGERLKGRVLQVAPDGQVTIELGTWKVRAKIGFQVRSGQILELVVVKSGRPLWLKALGESRPLAAESPPAGGNRPTEGAAGEAKILAAWLKSGLPEDVPPAVAKAMARMAELLSPLELAGSRSELAARLKDMIENGGHFFETRLAAIAASLGDQDVPQYQRSRTGQILAGDLKPAVLAAGRWLEGEAAARVLGKEVRKRLQAVVEAAGRRIEGRQKRMLLAAGKDGEGIFLDLQIPVAGRRRPVKFTVFCPRKGHKQGKGGHRVTLLLEMDLLGPVRADLALGRQRLDLGFFVCSQAVADGLENNLPLLQSELEKHFSKVECRVSVRKEEVERIQHRFRPETERRIDLLA